MSRAINTPPLVWHCTAGFSGIEAIEAFWHRPTNQNGLGWRGKGYLCIIDMQGDIWWLWDNVPRVGGYRKEYNPKAWEFVTNGVGGFNSRILNAATIGGVRNTGTSQRPVWVAVDTRNEKQIKAQYEVYHLYFEWLKQNGGDLSKSATWGHRDFSKDKNNNGAIESWERIKECPSYDVREHFRWLFNANGPINHLPKY